MLTNKDKISIKIKQYKDIIKIIQEDEHFINIKDQLAFNNINMIDVIISDEVMFSFKNNLNVVYNIKENKIRYYYYSINRYKICY